MHAAGGCNDPRREQALANVDQDYPGREPRPLSAQRIRPPGIPAADSAYVNAAAQAADDETADDRASQITQNNFCGENHA